MKRAVLIVAVAALCVAGSAVAQDRSGGLIGSGTRTEDSGQVVGSGNAAGQMVGSGGFTMSTKDQYLGNGDEPRTMVRSSAAAGSLAAERVEATSAAACRSLSSHYWTDRACWW